MSFSPDNFGDVADLAGLVQRRQNLKELRALSANLQVSQEMAKLQATYQDILFNFKLMTEKIDQALDLGKPDSLLMIYEASAQYREFNLTHEMFSSLEYKTLLRQLDNYFDQIESKARKTLGDSLHQQGQLFVLDYIKQRKAQEEAATAAENERLSKIEKERRTAENYMWIFLVGVIVLFIAVGFAMIHFSTPK